MLSLTVNKISRVYTATSIYLRKIPQFFRYFQLTFQNLAPSGEFFNVSLQRIFFLSLLCRIGVTKLSTFLITSGKHGFWEMQFKPK